MLTITHLLAPSILLGATSIATYVLSGKWHLYYFKIPFLGFRYHRDLPIIFRMDSFGEVNAVSVPTDQGAAPQDRKFYESFLDEMSGRFPAQAGRVIKEYRRALDNGQFGFERKARKEPYGFEQVFFFEYDFTLLGFVGGDIELIREIQRQFTSNLKGSLNN